MPVLSDSKFHIDGKSLDFNLIPEFESHPQGSCKYIYICVAKVCSTSINRALGHFYHPEPKFHHMGIEELKNYRPDLELSEYFKFGMVRNPWDRLVSVYHDFLNVRNGKGRIMNYSGLITKEDTIYNKSNGFEDFCFKFSKSDWVNEHHHRPQWDYLTIDGKIAVDFVGRFENVGRDWKIICENIGVDIPLGHARASNERKKSYRDYYNNETRDCIAEIYKKDIEEFDYEF
jgi:hypothetical protein